MEDTGVVAVAMRTLSFEWIAAPPLGRGAARLGRAGAAGEGFVKLFTIWQRVRRIAPDPPVWRLGPNGAIPCRDGACLYLASGLVPVTRAPMFITKPFVRDRKIRFALVGCGRISANHFDALDRHKERAELVGVCDIDPEALGAGRGADRGAGIPDPGRAAGRHRRRHRHPQHAERPPRRPGDPGGGGRPARDDREADGHPLAGRQADGPGLRPGRRAPVRGQAEPAERHPAAGQAGGGEEALRPDLHGQHQRVLDPAAVRTTTAPPGAGPGSSTAARS